MLIASTEFVEAAAAQSAALGFNAPAYFVHHPIQDRTDAEMIALADSAFAAVVALIVA